MRIALFTDTYVPDVNGVAVSVSTLYRVLKAQGHEVVVVFPNRNWKFRIEGDLVKLPGLVLKRLYGYRMSWLNSIQATKYLKRLNLDLIHVHTEAGVGIFGRKIAKKFDLPLVYTYHTMFEDYGHYVTKGMFERPTRVLIRRLSKLNAVRKVSELIVPSNKTKDYFRDLAGVNADINVVPTGIDFKRFTHLEDETKVTLLKQKYHLKEDDQVFISLGRVAKEKSIDICLRGYKEFLERGHLNSKFIVVGDGPARAELEALVLDLKLSDHVIFVGKVPVEEVPYYYRLGNVFVNASVTETQGLTYMEAMASGLIVMAKFDDNLSNIIINGKTGFFFQNEHDFVTIAEVVFSLNEARIHDITTRIQSMITQFSLETFYKNIMKTYEKALRQYW
ncbi:MAG: glycosyltransferase [Erysipelotrichaceae bacterium]|jgi:1,2-diacylglycerol 3-alpha-glucosyltransferase|nr:glycosyltransferase [Erysipelotrichaceae bacterium]